MIVPGSIKVMGRIPHTMRNFLKKNIGGGGVLRYGGVNNPHDPMSDLGVHMIDTWPIQGSIRGQVTLRVSVEFDVMAPFDEQEMEVVVRVHQDVRGRVYRLVFRWRISYGKPAGDDLLAVWPGAKNTLNKFLQQCYTLRPGQIIPYDGYTQAEVAEIGKQNLERMQKILGGFN